MTADRFVDAFGRRDADALADLLAEDAVAELVGSGYAPERGRAKIRAGALAHVLGGDGPPLLAERAGEGTLLLTRGAGGPVEMAVTVEWIGGRIRRLRFHTLFHDRAAVEAAAAGRPLAG